ncbi:MAG: tRNA dihydrouridine synthase DusB [Gammaproteobacteria bacterium]|nr:tRNA dihydrouridine synthase DusB [Gammaproteobacteria bacterium]
MSELHQYQPCSSLNKGFRIGPHRIVTSVILAPMAGITDRPFRTLCRQYGAGLAFSEMVSANPQLRKSRKSQLRLDTRGEKGIRAVQLVGTEPHTLADAARYHVGLGAQIIDINMGCPAKKVCNKAAGSALLKDEKLVGQILSAVVGAVDVPVTLKIRTGWDKANRNAVKISRIAENAGVQALSIHGRTRACAFSGEAEYQTIQNVKQSVSIPVIANGDINSAERAKRVLQITGADAIMIGRSACGRPWIFSEIRRYLENDQISQRPSNTEILNVMLTHVSELHSFYGDVMGVRIARKHIRWYLQQFVDQADNSDKQIYRVDSPEQQLLLLENLHDQLLEE